MTDKIMHYVCGLIFNVEKSAVALIRKKRGPYEMAGKLNAIGGKIENGEIPYDAMVRECVEETGANIASWHEFLVLQGYDWRVTFFKTVGDYELKTMTDEEIEWFDIKSPILQDNSQIMKNLKWIIPMALDTDIQFAVVTDGSIPK